MTKPDADAVRERLGAWSRAGWTDVGITISSGQKLMRDALALLDDQAQEIARLEAERRWFENECSPGTCPSCFGQKFTYTLCDEKMRIIFRGCGTTYMGRKHD